MATLTTEPVGFSNLHCSLLMHAAQMTIVVFQGGEAGILFREQGKGPRPSSFHTLNRSRSYAAMARIAF